jgi:pimeloyl-ACP methyl ester carboxylesterase
MAGTLGRRRGALRLLAYQSIPTPDRSLGAEQLWSVRNSHQRVPHRILPIAPTADRLPDLIADLRLVRVEDGPHNIGWTHPEEVNRALLEFLGQPAASRVGDAASAA